MLFYTNEVLEHARSSVTVHWLVILHWLGILHTHVSC